MNYNLSIKTIQKAGRIYMCLFWCVMILMGLWTIAYLHTSPDVEKMNTTNFLWGMSFFAFCAALFFGASRGSRRELKLQGSILTIYTYAFGAKQQVIDLSRVTGVYAGFLNIQNHLIELAMPNRSRGPYLQLSTDDGQKTMLYLSFYTQADRELFLPVVTELVHKPGIVLRGGSDLGRVLRTWFGDKAPAA